jgi:hypothetical protein
MLVGLLEKTYLQPKFKPRKGWYRMFEAKKHLIDLRGKEYLEVKWRIVWFRENNPKGCISTELENADPVIMKASVIDAEGNLLGTGYGTPKTQGAAKNRPFEGAETAAIGRALAVAGYGTQFTGEDEGEHLADAPIEKPATQPEYTPRPFSPETLKEKLAQSARDKGTQKASDGQRGFLVGEMSKIFSDNTDRYEVNEFLFGVLSSKKLTDAQVLTALNHVTNDNKMATIELKAALNKSQELKGQNSLFDKTPKQEQK